MIIVNKNDFPSTKFFLFSSFHYHNIQSIFVKLDLHDELEFTPTEKFKLTSEGLAVPIDGAAKNNAVFVFDFKNKAWSGYDQSDQIGKAGFCSNIETTYTNERTCVLGGGAWTAETGILDMFTFSFLGAERLFFLTTDGFISLYDDDMYSGDTDEGVDTANTSTRNITQTNISTEAVTRGYSFNSIDFKQRININRFDLQE